MRTITAMRTIKLLAAAGAALALVACGGDDQPAVEQPPEATTPPEGTTPTEATGTAVGGEEGLSASLSGPAEVPEGDPDGTGSAALTLDPATGEVCFQITVENIEPATAAHIHEGEAGTAGDIVIGLEPPTEGSVDGCVTGDRAVVERIIADPARFYVNVHNEEFPDGAVRGQLESNVEAP